MTDTPFLNEEKYDFKTDAKVLFTTGKGLNEDVVRKISAVKGEPEWMLEYRLKALEAFESMPLPSYGPDLRFLDFPSYTYYTRVAKAEESDWDAVPEAVKETFTRLGIPEAEQKYLAGVTTQYESEVVYHNMLDEVQKKGVVFLSTDQGLKSCPEIFKKYPSPESLASADIEDVAEDIKSITFPNSKARHLVGMARMLIDKFSGEVPSDPSELVKLPGVGRKTANVIASVVYNRPVIAVDTHVFRVARRLGLSEGKTVEAVEKDLTGSIAPEMRPKAHHWLILHGRYVCTARKPSCEGCEISRWCKSYETGTDCSKA